MIYLGTCNIEQIYSCNAANITNIISNSITNSGILRTYDEYVSNKLYFDGGQLIRLGAVSSPSPCYQTVNFSVFTEEVTLTDSGSIQIKITPDVTTKASVTVKVNIATDYYIWKNGEIVYDGPSYRTISIYIPSGTTPTTGITGTSYFKFSPSYQRIEITNAYMTQDDSPKILIYYENTSTSLQLQGALIPASYSNSLYTLGVATFPWNKFYSLTGYRVSKSTSYISSDYVDQSFNALIKYEPNLTLPSTGSIFNIGVSSKTPVITDYYNYSDQSQLGLYSQGSILIKSYGPFASGSIRIYSVDSDISLQSGESSIKLTADSYINITMFDQSLNINRRGLFVDWSQKSSGNDQTLYDFTKTDNMFWGSDISQIDMGGPWGIQVLWISSISSDNSYTKIFGSTKIHIYGAMFQEYGHNLGALGNHTTKVCCEISDSGDTGAFKNKITIYNDSAREISGWCWLMICYTH